MQWLAEWLEDLPFENEEEYYRTFEYEVEPRSHHYFSKMLYDKFDRFNHADVKLLRAYGVNGEKCFNYGIKSKGL